MTEYEQKMRLGNTMMMMMMCRNLIQSEPLKVLPIQTLFASNYLI